MAVIYTIYYDNIPNAIGGHMAYTGSSRRDLAPDDPYFAHDGSMSDRAKRRMRDNHARLGVQVVRGPVQIVWQGPADGTLLSREYATISRLRHNDPRFGYNLMPMLPGVNMYAPFRWQQHGDGVQHTLDCPFGVYHLRCHSGPDPDGNYWTTFTDLDGNTVEVYRGPHKSRAWKDYLAHKDKMIKLLRLDTPA